MVFLIVCFLVQWWRVSCWLLLLFFGVVVRSRSVGVASSLTLRSRGTPQKRGAPQLYVRAMIKKLREHFANIKNIAIYCLVGIVFTLELFDKGMREAVITVAELGFLISGMYVGISLASFKLKNYSYGVGDFFSYAYFIGFCIYWLSEYGVTRKAFVLMLPIYLGLVITLAVIFSASNSARRLDRWGKGMLKILLSIFRAKP